MAWPGRAPDRAGATGRVVAGEAVARHVGADHWDNCVDGKFAEAWGWYE